ncbi:MAG: hypothetical protein ACP5IB_09305 [Thermoplasmata archaeon]
MKVEIKLEHEYTENNNFIRIVDMKVGSGKYLRVYPSASNTHYPGEISSEISSSLTLMEGYIILTRDELREMDGDREKQMKFIKRKILRKYTTNLIIIPKILLKEGELLDEKDIRYLIDLLSFNDNILIVPPLLYLYEISNKGRITLKKPIDQEEYIKFISEFLKICNEYGIKQVAFTLPFNIPYSLIPQFLNIYKDISTPIIIIDANGNTLMDNYIQLRPLLGYTKEKMYSIREKEDEKFFLYLFDGKPYTRTADFASAINVLEYDLGFSSFGRRHTIKIKPNLGINTTTRLYYMKEISYGKSNIPEVTDYLKNWLIERNISFSQEPENNIRKYKEAFEAIELKNTIEEVIYNGAKENSLDNYLNEKKYIQNDIKRIRKNVNKLLNNP